MCTVALRATDALASRGLETTDAPRLWLCAVQRWALGHGSGSLTAAATRSFRAVARSGTDGPIGHVMAACELIHKARRRFVRGNMVTWGACLDACAHAMTSATADPLGAVQATTKAWFEDIKERGAYHADGAVSS